MLDYSEKRENGFDLIPEGEYECTARCDGEKTTPRGTETIALSWRIRDDILQHGAGRVIFDDIYRDKNNPTQYNDRKIYDIVFGGQDKNDPNSRFKFEDYDDLCQHLNGLNMLIEVEIDEYNGVKRNRVRLGGYHPSKAKGRTLGAPEQAKPAAPAAASYIDDDLPF